MSDLRNLFQEAGIVVRADERINDRVFGGDRSLASINHSIYIQREIQPGQQDAVNIPLQLLE